MGKQKKKFGQSSQSFEVYWGQLYFWVYINHSKYPCVSFERNVSFPDIRCGQVHQYTSSIVKLLTFLSFWFFFGPSDLLINDICVKIYYGLDTFFSLILPVWLQMRLYTNSCGTHKFRIETSFQWTESCIIMQWISLFLAICFSWIALWC